MDARLYAKLIYAIAAADSAAALEALRHEVRTIDMHPVQRHVIERVLRSRADTLRLRDSEATRPRPERGDEAEWTRPSVTDNRELLERIYDAGGLFRLDAPDDDVAYPAFHDTVETLLTMTRDGYIECEATPDRTRRGRTYLAVVVRITAAGRALVEHRRPRSGDWP